MSDATILALVNKTIDTSELTDTMQEIKRLFWKGEITEKRTDFMLQRGRAQSYHKKIMNDKAQTIIYNKFAIE